MVDRAARPGHPDGIFPSVDISCLRLLLPLILVGLVLVLDEQAIGHCLLADDRAHTDRPATEALVVLVADFTGVPLDVVADLVCRGVVPVPVDPLVDEGLVHLIEGHAVEPWPAVIAERQVARGEEEACNEDQGRERSDSEFHVSLLDSVLVTHRVRCPSRPAASWLPRPSPGWRGDWLDSGEGCARR